jgi:15-cis-phytoene desaturase
LRQRGVTFQNGTTIKSFSAEPTGVTSVRAEVNGESRQLTADYYISALPVEIMTELVDENLKALAPSFANLDKLCTAWMNGIQFYPPRDVALEFGHSSTRIHPGGLRLYPNTSSGTT